MIQSIIFPLTFPLLPLQDLRRDLWLPPLTCLPSIVQVLNILFNLKPVLSFCSLSTLHHYTFIQFVARCPDVP